MSIWIWKDSHAKACVNTCVKSCKNTRNPSSAASSNNLDVKHLASASLQHFVSEQSSPGSEHCPGVVVVDVEAEVDPEVDEVVASLAQVGTSNAITQVELAVMASHGIIWHPLNLLAIEIWQWEAKTEQTMIEEGNKKLTMIKVGQTNMTKSSQHHTTNHWTSLGLCPSLSAQHLPHGATHSC